MFLPGLMRVQSFMSFRGGLGAQNAEFVFANSTGQWQQWIAYIFYG